MTVQIDDLGLMAGDPDDLFGFNGIYGIWDTVKSYASQENVKKALEKAKEHKVGEKVGAFIGKKLRGEKITDKPYSVEEYKDTSEGGRNWILYGGAAAAVMIGLALLLSRR